MCNNSATLAANCGRALCRQTDGHASDTEWTMLQRTYIYKHTHTHMQPISYTQTRRQTYRQTEKQTVGRGQQTTGRPVSIDLNWLAPGFKTHGSRATFVPTRHRSCSSGWLRISPVLLPYTAHTTGERHYLTEINNSLWRVLCWLHYM